MIADMQKHEIATQHRFSLAFLFFFSKIRCPKKKPPPSPQEKYQAKTTKLGKNYQVRKYIKIILE